MQENKPTPLVAEDREKLTWEAATERFLDVASIQSNEWPSRPVKAQDLVFWRLYNTGIGAPRFPFMPCPAHFLALDGQEMAGMSCLQTANKPSLLSAMVAVH